MIMKAITLIFLFQIWEVDRSPVLAAVALPRPTSTTTASPLLMSERTRSEKEYVTLACPVLPSEKRIIFWTHYMPPAVSNKTTLFAGSKKVTKNPRFSVLTNSSLHINSVQREDNGYFACAFHGAQPMASYRLNVLPISVSIPVPGKSPTLVPQGALLHNSHYEGSKYAVVPEEILLADYETDVDIDLESSPVALGVSGETLETDMKEDTFKEDAVRDMANIALLTSFSATTISPDALHVENQEIAFLPTPTDGMFSGDLNNGSENYIWAPADEVTPKPHETLLPNTTTSPVDGLLVEIQEISLLPRLSDDIFNHVSNNESETLIWTSTEDVAPVLRGVSVWETTKPDIKEEDFKDDLILFSRGYNDSTDQVATEVTETLLESTTVQQTIPPDVAAVIGTSSSQHLASPFFLVFCVLTIIALVIPLVIHVDRRWSRLRSQMPLGSTHLQVLRVFFGGPLPPGPEKQGTYSMVGGYS